MMDAVRIPAIVGVDHVGLTVPDMDEAVAFFRDALGCLLISSRGPTPPADPEKSAEVDEFLKTNLGVRSGTRVKAITMLRCGHGSNIELFDYTCADRDERRPNNADAGGHHVAFYTDDLAAAAAHLKAHGATIMGDQKTVSWGPEAGLQWFYFLAPWGLQLEMVSYPDGKAYEHNSDGRKLWSPKQPSL